MPLDFVPNVIAELTQLEDASVVLCDPEGEHIWKRYPRGKAILQQLQESRLLTRQLVRLNVE